MNQILCAGEVYSFSICPQSELVELLQAHTEILQIFVHPVTCHCLLAGSIRKNELWWIDKEPSRLRSWAAAADRWLTIGALHYAANLETLMEYEQYEASAPSPSSCCKLYCLRSVAFWLRFQQILTERNSPEGKNLERVTLMPSVTKGSGLDWHGILGRARRIIFFRSRGLEKWPIAFEWFLVPSCFGFLGAYRQHKEQKEACGFDYLFPG